MKSLKTLNLRAHPKSHAKGWAMSKKFTCFIYPVLGGFDRPKMLNI